MTVPSSKKILACALLGLACTAPYAGAQTIPSDPTPSCTVSSSTFSSWFASGTPTVNGVVNPANSIAFQPSSNCAFFQWSEQMFMWLTSPAPSSYGGTGPIFQSNAFYQVVPVPGSTTGQLQFLQNPSMQPMQFGLRAAKVDANGLAVMFDNKHVRHEILPMVFAKDGKQLIAVAGGKQVEINKVAFDKKGTPMLLDVKGKAIKPQLKTALAAPAGQPTRVQEVLVPGKKSVFLDMNGFPIIPDQGQAGGGGVLIAQNGSLVYYATFVNDVFAYYLTQVLNANGGTTPNGTQFPTDTDDLASIVAYAKLHGVTFPDPDALAIEVKTSWVVPVGLNPANYVTTNAAVPTYTKTPTQWTATNNYIGTPLALVGLHVVGSATNHPEMIWSTFEHFGNAPNGAYSYVNSANQTVSVPQNTSGAWLFCQTNCQATASNPFNNELAHFVSPNILASNANFPIGPSNTMRWHAFGAAANTSPNSDATAPASNSLMISINNSVLGQTLNGDVRKNYFFVGSTWTNGGVTPDNPFYGNPNPSPTPNFPPGNEIGTSQISNATMETYQQASIDNSFAQDGNCFQCHNASTAPPKATVEVSHIWPHLLPLFAN